MFVCHNTGDERAKQGATLCIRFPTSAERRSKITATRLLQISDQINRVINLAKAASMAANDDLVPEDAGDPIAALLAVILDELRAIRDQAFDQSKEQRANA